MSFLPDDEKRLLLSAISREKKICKDNGYKRLVPFVENLENKFMYDRIFRKIYSDSYNEGMMIGKLKGVSEFCDWCLKNRYLDLSEMKDTFEEEVLLLNRE